MTDEELRYTMRTFELLLLRHGVTRSELYRLFGKNFPALFASRHGETHREVLMREHDIFTIAGSAHERAIKLRAHVSVYRPDLSELLEATIVALKVETA